ncbi:hypothetical protein LUW76_06875 [Actinomadura madurae]|uniref:hypothetical protein n=1 Tax=Actinomadura madurae TaxID=1993 RepID=UPI002026E19E|nr:hypothetical protein [Actinomadura madurae]URM94072.1 hypothetical protein LUW76_06875 [Actinomadura madurae]
MPYSLEDLTEVMETRSAGGRPSPDLLPRVRRRIRWGNRRRAAGGAAGTALAVAAAFGAVQQFGQAPGDGGPPVMTGAADAAFAKSPPREGMDPVRELGFRLAGAKAGVRFTPTGPDSMITFRCSAQFTVYEVRNGVLSSVGCEGNNSGVGYLRTKAGDPVEFSTVALPLTAPQPSSVAELDRYLAAHEPFPATWSVQIYSGTCTSSTCRSPVRAVVPRPPVDGLKRIARTTRTADGRPRTIAFTPSGRTVRFRVGCVDGAAVAVVRGAGRSKIVECERAESVGVVWDGTAEPGERNGLTVAVLPAEAGTVAKGDDASLAAKMQGVEPAGKWTFEVYER